MSIISTIEFCIFLRARILNYITSSLAWFFRFVSFNDEQVLASNHEIFQMQVRASRSGFAIGSFTGSYIAGVNISLLFASVFWGCNIIYNKSWLQFICFTSIKNHFSVTSLEAMNISWMFITPIIGMPRIRVVSCAVPHSKTRLRSILFGTSDTQRSSRRSTGTTLSIGISTIGISSCTNCTADKEVDLRQQPAMLWELQRWRGKLAKRWRLDHWEIEYIQQLGHTCAN